MEGIKSVLELLNSEFEIEFIIATEKCLRDYPILLKISKKPVIIAGEKELNALSALESNGYVLAVARMKTDQLPDQLKDDIILVLDDIRDPGNFGTIIRTADWYGVKNIIASEYTAEFYNPKVISSSMGSFTRVNVFYLDLETVLPKMSNYLTYGTFLNGRNIHTTACQKPALIVMGNESNGIRKSLMPYIQHKISIPKFGKAESLNVAISTGIILDHFKR